MKTLFTDSCSSNYYYTTLYIGEKKKQTYLIDTSTNIFSSPCAPCDICGKQKNNYLDKNNKNANNPLKCDSNICKIIPSNGRLEKNKSSNEKHAIFIQKK